MFQDWKHRWNDGQHYIIQTIQTWKVCATPTLGPHPPSSISCSVAYVSRSGGMSNELNNVISHWTNGVYEGVAIGGDRYPGTTFIDHILRYHEDPNVKMIVVLGEVRQYSVVQLHPAPFNYYYYVINVVNR